MWTCFIYFKWLEFVYLNHGKMWRKKKIDFKIYNSFWEHIGANKHCGACGALLFTMDCSHLVCFIYIFLVLSSSFLNANAVMLNGKLSEWRFFVIRNKLWFFIYLNP